jgi:hypothetical protein
MAVPILNLNLAPRPTLWRQRHHALGWTALGLGTLFLAGTIGFTWHAYHQANRAGRDVVSLTEEARRAGQREQQLQASLQDLDAAREQSRWKLAERILQERSLPWSRLTAELEQCMVPDMRLKGLQRVRSNSQQVVMKLKGEARNRVAEAAFVDALRSTPVFAQVILERESERTGGGWDFEISLPTAPVPPPFEVKAIKQGPAIPSPTTVAAHPAGRPATVPVRTMVPAPAAPLLPAPPPQVSPALQPAPADEEGTARRRWRPVRKLPTPAKDPQ